MKVIILFLIVGLGNLAFGIIFTLLGIGYGAGGELRENALFALKLGLFELFCFCLMIRVYMILKKNPFSKKKLASQSILIFGLVISTLAFAYGFYIFSKYEWSLLLI